MVNPIDRINDWEIAVITGEVAVLDIYTDKEFLNEEQILKRILKGGK